MWRQLGEAVSAVPTQLWGCTLVAVKARAGLRILGAEEFAGDFGGGGETAEEVSVLGGRGWDRTGTQALVLLGSSTALY